MLLPGENYSERLMFSMQGYRETWVDGRAATLYGEAYSALNEASELSKADKKVIDQAKKAVPGSDIVDLAFDLYDVGKKGARFSKAAAPLILADGPLPFGDVIFAIALGIDLGIAAYNLVVDNE